MPLFHLPPFDITSVRPYVEMRERLESRTGRDDILTRIRVGANSQLSPKLTAELQYQFAYERSTTHSDVSLAYLQLKAEGSAWTVGRQKIAIGNQRLIGPLEWSNVARSFDGVRVKANGWDLWAAKVGLSYPLPRDARLAAASYASTYGLSSLIADWDGAQDIYTFDHLYDRKVNRWRMDFEGALQGGRNAGRRHEAWAVHGRAAYDLSVRHSLFIEANAASGGGTGNVSRTFNNLFPTNHPFYGIMDLQGWKNMNELALGLDLKARNDLLVRASWHGFSLRDSSDAWYGAGGAPNRFAGGTYVDPTGTSGRDVGNEIDLEAAWTVNKAFTLSGGVATFNPGTFVRKLSGNGDRQYWGFLQAQYRF
jgi:hypothetical protein